MGRPLKASRIAVTKGVMLPASFITGTTTLISGAGVFDDVRDAEVLAIKLLLIIFSCHTQPLVLRQLFVLFRGGFNLRLRRVNVATGAIKIDADILATGDVIPFHCFDDVKFKPDGRRRL